MGTKMKTFSKDNRLTVIMIIAALLILIVVGFYFCKFGRNGLSGNPSDWSNFGGYIGGTLSPILAFFSFLALCHTIRLQNKQLQLSEDTQKIQRFEGIFTYMANELSRMQDDLNELSIQNVLKHSSGRTYSYAKVRAELRLNPNYPRFFIYLYQILRLIDKQDENTISFQDKKRYSNIIRSGLNNSIMQLCFLNSLVIDIYDDDFKKYKELLEKYHFFEHMPFQYKPKNNLDYFFFGLTSLYNFQAFGNNQHLKNAIINILMNHTLSLPKYEWKNQTQKNQLFVGFQWDKQTVRFSNKETSGHCVSFNLNSLAGVVAEHEIFSSAISFKELKFIYKNQEYQLEVVFPNLFMEINLVLINSTNKETTIFNFVEIEEC